MPKSTGTKRTGSRGGDSKSNASSTKRAKQQPATLNVGLCLESKAGIDLDPGKLYRVLPDRESRARGFLRVVDESGEDYLYPVAYFKVLRLPTKVANKLVRVT